LWSCHALQLATHCQHCACIGNSHRPTRSGRSGGVDWRLDEDEAGVAARVALARLDVATDQCPLAMTTSHSDRLPRRLALKHPVTRTPTTAPPSAAAPPRVVVDGQLLTLDTDERAWRQTACPVVTGTRASCLGHLQLGAVPATSITRHSVPRPKFHGSSSSQHPPSKCYEDVASMPATSRARGIWRTTRQTDKRAKN